MSVCKESNLVRHVIGILGHSVLDVAIGAAEGSLAGHHPDPPAPVAGLVDGGLRPPNEARHAVLVVHGGTH